MKPIISILILFFILFHLPDISMGANVAGNYSSTEGNLTLHQNSDRVHGNYSKDNGELTGLMFGNIFEGFWIEDGSDRRCATPKNSRYHWGRVTFEFNQNGFVGRWGYCDDKPSRSWSGSSLSGNHPHKTRSELFDDNAPFQMDTELVNLEGVWGSSEGDIRFHQKSQRISGSYTKDNGEIVGILNKDLLRGYWIEDHSAKRCNAAKNGRYYWGKLEFKFSNDTFIGKWGYCDEPVTGNWQGERK